MSNQPFPGTVIEDERTVYYDCGIGLKGSASGRFSSTELGYSIDFPPDQPFRGVHTNVSIERAGNMKEIVTKHILNRAGGGYWSQYDDVAKVIGPGGVNAPALIAAAAHDERLFEEPLPRRKQRHLLQSRTALSAERHRRTATPRA